MLQALKTVSAVRQATRQMSTAAAAAATQKERLVIFDTTLRDGEQSPGVTLTRREKLHIARQLSRLGVSVCEAGFPAASEGDFDSVTAIAQEVGALLKGRQAEDYMAIAGLARCREQDIQRCYDAVRHAPRHRIHTFLATSDIHLKHKLKISREACIKQVQHGVAFAKSLCDDIEFSCEDAGRSDKDFLVDVIAAAIEAGATTINVPDTVGYQLPEEYGALIRHLVTHTPGAERAIFSTHCHNDLGLATANTLAGVRNGARQVEVTINGIGERAGNTSLEEVVMAIDTHPTLFPVHTTIDTPQIMRCSQLVQSYSGMRVQPNKAIVGANAFAHESGIHQDGMLKHAATYEIIRPERVGVRTSLVMGKLSGRAAFKVRMAELGYDNLNDDEIMKAFTRFKRVADTGKTITDQDLHAIVKDELDKPTSVFQLRGVQVTTGDHIQATATATVVGPDDREIIQAAVGSGPVNAIFKAIVDAVKIPVELQEYHVKSITAGTDALGEVSVTVRQPGQTTDDDSFTGVGAHSDILVASAHAYLNAINKLVLSGAERKTESPEAQAEAGAV